MDGSTEICGKKLMLPGALIHKAETCKTSTAFLLFALTAVFCTFQPIIRQALPASHDISFHLFQAEQFASAIGDGIALPRWVAAANNGHGSPNFIFYAPFSYYFTALLSLVTGSVPASMIATIWFSFFFSGVGMFHAASRLAGREGALIAAVLYQLLPYHLLDLYARGTFAELFAFPWFPLILLCAHGIFEAEVGEYRFAIGLSLAYAGLILTHLVSGYMFTFVLFAYLAFNYLRYGSGKDLLLGLVATSVALALSSFYLLPAALEGKFVRIDYLVKCQVGDYRRNFLFLPRGYQEGLHGFYPMLHRVTVLNLVLFLAIIFALRKFQRQQQLSAQLAFFTTLFSVSLFLLTPLSAPLWQTVPGFPTLQFPWRWLSIMEVSSCILLAGLLSARARQGAAAPATIRPVWLCLTAIAAVSLLIVAKSNLTHETRPGAHVVAREYTPASVQNLERLLARRQERISTLEGTVSSEIRLWQGERRAVEVRATTPAVIRVGTSYYPGWEARLDGATVRIAAEKESGEMLIRVPQGSHNLTLEFTDTPLRLFGKSVSLAAAVTLFLYGVLCRYRPPRPAKASAAPESAGG